MNQYVFMERILKRHKRIALVAHDHKKKDLLDWCVQNRASLEGHELIATGTTGKLIEERIGMQVRRLLSGPLGGDQQIGALIAEGNVDVLIFFWDPMAAQPHDPDIKALLRLAVAWNLPFACDRATADFLLTSPHMQSEYVCAIPDYGQYLNRSL